MRFTTVPPRSLLFASLLLTGCATRSYGFEACLEDPSRARAYEPHLQKPRVTVRLRGCYQVVTADLPTGRHESRPFKMVDDFVTAGGGTRLAYVGYAERVHVVIDGVESPPYDEILWPPTFSADGRHVGYLARADRGDVLVVDDDVKLRGRQLSRDHFLITDDGRAAAVAIREDGDQQVVFGDQWSEVFDEMSCERSLRFVGGRLSFVARRKNDLLAFVDLKAIDVPGVPVGCRVHMSADGARFAYVSHDLFRSFDRGEPEEISEYRLVVDGEVQLLQGRGDILKLTPSLTLVAVEEGDGTTLWVLGAATPAETSDDEYRPPAGRAVRVRLGDSLGPAFDSVDRDSFEISPEREVSYVGLRNGVRHNVIGNRLATPTEPEVLRQAVEREVVQEIAE
ncbi:MAG: hypothetical protein R3B72_25905 [Polyangiaceae bacterium]